MAPVEQTLATPPRWVAWALRASAVLVIVACAAAWLAVERAHRRELAEARAVNASLAATIDTATASAGLARQLQASVDALAVSSGSTGEAVSHTVAISENLRALVAVVAGGNVTGPQADQLATVTNNLGDIEAALLETQGGLSETERTLTDAQPLVNAAAATLQALPDNLRTTSDSRSRARSAGDDGRLWWRLAIVLSGVVLLAMVAALLALVRRTPQP